jgi:3-oxoacyl-[acyl-carrier-protein] synthase-3
MPSIRVRGTGSYVPPKVLSNHDLEAMGLDTSDEWIHSRTGVRERRVAEPDVCTSDLALEACRRALAVAELTPEDIDLIVLGTITPDTCCPAGANWLQAKLGATRAVTFDVTAACSGFVFALSVAQQYLATGTYSRVLVVAAEVMTRTVDWTDRSTCILWGDGAGAAVLEQGESGPELLTVRIFSSGKDGEDLLVPGGGSRTTPISHESVEKKLHSLNMIEAAQSFRVAVRHFAEAVKEGATAAGVSVSEIDWFIPHQANVRMFTTLAKMLGVPFERFYMTIEKYGNMSSASCAVAFDEAVRDGTIRSGDIVCLPVFGGGLTWGSALFRWEGARA